jgi:hypothetical protein
MSYTITLVNIPDQPTTKNAAMAKITVADFKAPTVIADTAPQGGSSSHHKFALSGSDGKGTYLDLSVKVSPEKVDAAGNPQINTRATATLTTLALAVDATSGKELKFPVQAGVFFNYPSNVRELSVADLAVIVESIVSVVLAGYDASTGVPAGAVLSNLCYETTSALS